MLHIRTKVLRSIRSFNKNKTLRFALFGTLALPVVIFFVTRGSTPYTSELAIVEHSILGKAAGSVVPASGESYPTYETYQTYANSYETYQTYANSYETYQTYANSYETYQTYGNSYETYQTYGPSYPSYNSYETYETYNSYESYPSYPTYSGPATISSFSITPRSVERGGLVSINWSIYHPTNSCKISAAVQRPAVCDAACVTARNNASSTINTALASGTTNANDPYGASRPMLTALRQALNSPSGYARGVKSINLQYSTTFTLSCGTTTTPYNSIIYVTDRVEG